MPATALDLDQCPYCGAYDLVARGGHPKCMGCGRSIEMAGLAACPRCGEILPSPDAAREHCSPVVSEDGSVSAGESKRLGGWLLVLGISLAVGAPVVFISQLVQRASSIGRALGQPALRALMWSGLAMDLAIVGILAAAGFLILRVHPGAARFCRRALVIALILAVAEFGLVYVLLDPGAFARVVPGVTFRLTWNAILSVGWLVYLHRSRRVRSTFPG
jgi:DNA-directed RNA polymerase subunit RPC12/RpoP